MPAAPPIIPAAVRTAGNADTTEMMVWSPMTQYEQSGSVICLRRADHGMSMKAVDGGVGADFDVVADPHAAGLGNFTHAPAVGVGSGAAEPSAPITTPA
jgi:hypothetical protein